MSDRSPRGAKSGSTPFARITAVKRRRNVGDVPDERTLGGADGIFGVNGASTPNASMKPLLLGFSVVARPGERAGMANRSSQLGFPTANDAGDDGFVELQVALVISAGFHIKHCRP